MGASQIRPFPAASAPQLGQKLQRKLENAGVSSSRNLAELPVGLHRVGIVEVHVVEHVESLGVKLHGASLGDSRTLDQAHIGREIPGAA